MMNLEIFEREVINLQDGIIHARTQTFKKHLISKLEGVVDLAVMLGIIESSYKNFIMNYRIDTKEKLN